jgi:G:T-mismatch repair DNA endonuclease (very short patch repair protein)
LRDRGFRVVTVWQCELDEPERLAHRLSRLLRARPAKSGGI